ncbi:TaqI-like C-terminal specificity domain-containing protein [Myroides odoratimimus]|uniref:TaqI-like C-terminal specificity domain-containing protein n=1 Tax=Myroides odoratimimus TaxID=76832 RepID=UPI0025763AA9|nr:TaqI-like C-terminal specificity domain-containing protein [Myroides odoratimimus]
MTKINLAILYDFKTSIYFEQYSNISSFNTTDSWIVLSEMEQRIKSKIEAVGTPLKDWDINIYRGILTGYNEAFIIDGEKRDELIAADPKSAEIIRPILRGRDIKRYGYDFADKYLICARLIAEIPINYPAINEHLTAYIGSKQLGDNSTTKVFKRPWWSWMQEPINYWDNFFGQKIIYPNMTKFLPFYLDDKSFMHNDKSFMITGENIAYLTAFLNSSLFKYCFIDNFPELQGGTRELRKVFLDKIPVLQVSKNINLEFEKLVSEVQELKSNQLCTTEIELEIDRRIFELYSLSEEEKDIIGFIEIK